MCVCKHTIRAYCNVATMILVTVTSPYRYRVQYINLIHYNMKAKRISQIDGNTALLDTGKHNYETHIAAFNEYTLVISGMQFLIVSDPGWYVYTENI